MRITNQAKSPNYLCENYPKAFSEPSTPKRKFQKNVGNFKILAACPHCFAEIINIFEFKEVHYSSDLIGSRYDFNSKKMVKFNEETTEYRKYLDLESENIKQVAALIDDEMNRLKTGLTCPLCHKHIEYSFNIKTVGESLNSDAIDKLLKYRRLGWLYGDSEIKRHSKVVFKNIKADIQHEEKEKAKERLSNLYKKYALSTFDANDPVDKKIIQENTSNLKEYIAAIVKLESNERWLTERLEQLYLDEKDIGRLAVHEKALKINSKREKVVSCEEKCKKIIEQIQQLNEITMSEAGFILPTMPSKPTEPIYETPGFFNKKKVMSENERKRIEYQDKCTNYDNELKAYEQKTINQERAFNQFIISKREALETELKDSQDNLDYFIKKSNEEIEKMLSTNLPIEELKNSITEEIDTAEKLLKDTLITKKRFYSLGVIFEKYRDLIPLSTFYEYLMAGRCDTLEGANGAYNIFESELRANVIIKELSDIKNTLEEIKNNQYMVYSELKNIQNSLSELKEGMQTTVKTINGNLDIIAKNTEVTAFYSKVNAYYAKKNAELTNALGFLIALK